MRTAAKFFANFVRHPQSVGAIAPSSVALARRMVEETDFGRADTVVELGPGTGPFTRTIEESLGENTLYLALELNENFVRELSSKGFERAKIIHDSAENLPARLAEHEREHADSIFCGLPWAGFPEELQERIMSAVLASLPQGGQFASFAYIHAAWLPRARRFRRWLESHFSEVKCSPTVWGNLPPAFVYHCRK